MNRVIKSALLALAVTGAAQAQSDFTPPPIGTMVTWSFGSENERSTRLSEVVANGSDFAIFLSDLRLDADTAASYVVEFSGIHVTSCAQDMPSEAERLALLQAWPLKSGQTIRVAHGQAATYEIGKLTSHTLNAIEGPTQARQIKAIFGSVENDITLSLDWNMAVAVSWPDGSGDRALEVVPPQGAPSRPRDISRAIGNCASLLSK